MIVNAQPLATSSPRLLATAALLLAGCAARTDDKYNGEVLLSLHGTVTDHRTSPPPDVNLYLLWPSGKPAGSVFIAETLELHPTFPVTFTLDVFTPPPIVAVPNGPRITNGIFVAGTPSAEFDAFLHGNTSVSGSGVLGFDPRHVLFYLPDGAPPGELLASLLHGPATPGFHVADVRCIGPAKAAEIRACIAAMGPQPDPKAVLDTCGSLNPDLPTLSLAPADLDTELTVELVDDVATYQPDPAECL